MIRPSHIKETVAKEKSDFWSQSDAKRSFFYTLDPDRFTKTGRTENGKKEITLFHML